MSQKIATLSAENEVMQQKSLASQDSGSEIETLREQLKLQTERANLAEELMKDEHQQTQDENAHWTASYKALEGKLKGAKASTRRAAATATDKHAEDQKKIAHLEAERQQVCRAF